MLRLYPLATVFREVDAALRESLLFRRSQPRMELLFEYAEQIPDCEVLDHATATPRTGVVSGILDVETMRTKTESMEFERF